MFQRRVIQMSNQDLKQILKNDPIVIPSNMPRYEALKGVTTGELITLNGNSYDIGQKEYVEREDGSFEIWLYDKIPNNAPIVIIPNVPQPEVLKLAMKKERITVEGITHLITDKLYLEQPDGSYKIYLFKTEQ
jgi:hypothetical protein